MINGTNLYGDASTTLSIALTDKYGYAMLASCTGAASAQNTAGVFQHGCLLNRTDSGTGTNALYQNTGSVAVPSWTLLDTGVEQDATVLVDSNGVVSVAITTTASAVNGLLVTNSATGAVSANAVILSPGAPSGADPAISITLRPLGVTGLTVIGLTNGTGSITVGSSSTTQTVNVGTGAGVSTINVGTGAAANIIKIGAAASLVTTFGTPTAPKAVNYVVAGGSNNAITATLNDSTGAAIPTAAGVRVVLLMTGVTLQAGANTLNLNGTSAIAIKKSSAPTVDLAVARAANSIIDLIFNGTSWLEMSE